MSLCEDVQVGEVEDLPIVTELDDSPGSPTVQVKVTFHVEDQSSEDGVVEDVHQELEKNCDIHEELEIINHDDQKNLSKDEPNHEVIEPLSPPPSTVAAPPTKSTSWLLRLFESKLFNMSIALTYLHSAKEQGVLSYLGNRMFTFPDEEVDFYLPQLVTLYVSNLNLAESLHPYLVSRCRQSICTSLHVVWLLNAFCGDERSSSNSKTTSTRLPTNSNHQKFKSQGAKLRELILSKGVHPTCNVPENGFKKSAILNNYHQHQQKNICSLHRKSKVHPSAMLTVQSHSKTHYRSHSDATCASQCNAPGTAISPNGSTGVQNGVLLRVPSNGTIIANGRKNSSTLGDLSTGRAFDNGCACFQSNSSVCPFCVISSPLAKQISRDQEAVSLKQQQQCHCGASNIGPQYEFIQALMNIGRLHSRNSFVQFV